MRRNSACTTSERSGKALYIARDLNKQILSDLRATQLRPAIFPVDPIHVMSRQESAHGFAEGREEGLLAQARKESEALQLVLDRILHLGETQLDSGGAQGVVEFGKRVACGDVDARDRLRRDHEPTDRCGRARNSIQNSFMKQLGIREEEGR